MNLDSLTREEVIKFLADETSIDDFRAWLRPVAWGLGDDEETRIDSALTRKLVLLIAEYNLGHRAEDEVRELMADEVEHREG
jgi:hypothetical protein